MPFARKKFYRRGYTSKYRRYKRTFSKYNTYRNRSATAQANQIYKLNRRVTKIESATKPEYLEYVAQTISSNVPVAVDNNGWSELQRIHVSDGSVDNQGVATGFAAQIKESSARQIKLIVWGTLERNPAPLGQDVNTLTHDIPFACCYIRIAVVQYIAERYADASGYEFFTNTGGPSAWLAPLKKGCGTHGRVLKVINLKISTLDQVTKNFKYTIRIKNKIVRRTSSGGTLTGNQRMKGGIVLLPVGMVEKNNQEDPPQFWLNTNAKVIYTDA